MSSPEPVLDDLARTLRLNIGRIARTLRSSHRNGELTLSETSLLSRIENAGSTTPGALAEAENVRPQAIAATLTSLESMGYLNRDPDPQDGRRTLVSLSSKGIALRKERSDESVARLSQALAEVITPEELPQLRAAIALIARVGDAL